MSSTFSIDFFKKSGADLFSYIYLFDVFLFRQSKSSLTEKLS